MNPMTVRTHILQRSTKGNACVVNLTDDVADAVRASKIKDGIVTVSIIGSTAALTTCEYEPGLIEDIKAIFDKLIPAGRYRHDEAWHDGNGHSHLRSSLVGPSLTIPFKDSAMILGTWQQIILIDFDNRPRERKIAVQIMGE